MKPKYCTNCEKEVKPKDSFSCILFVFLLLLAIIPGIIYLIYNALFETPRCPICNLKIKEEKK